MWAILSAIYPARANASRIQQYYRHEHKLNMRGIQYPVQLKDVTRFENQNNISVSVFGYEKGKEGFFPLRITEKKKVHHVNLLLISQGETSHDLWIKNLSRLLFQATGRATRSKTYFCNYCLQGFRQEEMLKQHEDDCQKHGPQKMLFPSEKEKFLEFNNIKAMLPAPSQYMRI